MRNKLKNILISAEQTIRDALLAINSDTFMKIAIVVDKKRKLKGVITDGDVRRALLSGFSLDAPAIEIMNCSPVTAEPDSAKKDLIAIMEERGIFAIPILNEGVLVGVETYHDASKRKSYENPVFLMAGGFGTRLRPLTDNCPKPLLDIGGRPLLETALISFVNSGFKNFYISTHYLHEMIRDYFGSGSKWGVNITYVHEESPLGTGGALGLLPIDMPDLPIIIMNGDVLTTIDFEKLLDFHLKNKAAATLCVREYEYQVPYGVIKGDGHNVVSMEEKPVHNFFVNAGIYVIDPPVIRSVTKNEYLDMPALLEQKIKKNHEVLMFPIHEYWLDIGRIEDFRRAQEDYASLNFPESCLTILDSD
jgi:UDP-2,4-diacetamido-2,4,6-trideoxy-beta-L-gulopyranose hydrolase